MKSYRIILGVALFSTALLSACAQQATPTLSPTPTPTQTRTPTLTPTPVSTPLPTTLPAMTPTPTPTPTAIATPTPATAAGERLFRNNGCIACHRINGEGGTIGPSLSGTWGKSVKLTNGQTVTRNEGYFEESIKDPGAKIVEGFPPGIMPKVALTDSEISEIIAFIRSLTR